MDDPTLQDSVQWAARVKGCTVNAIPINTPTPPNRTLVFRPRAPLPFPVAPPVGWVTLPVPMEDGPIWTKDVLVLLVLEVLQGDHRDVVLVFFSQFFSPFDVGLTGGLAIKLE
ncbi:hypothetical protein WG66_002929 [Moniliophthora roreri]|nr:hypothetical protein WG66_002929 [Moniliophthora roreri]